MRASRRKDVPSHMPQVESFGWHFHGRRLDSAASRNLVVPGFGDELGASLTARSFPRPIRKRLPAHGSYHVLHAIRPSTPSRGVL